MKKRIFSCICLSLSYTLANSQDNDNNKDQAYRLNAITATSHLQGYETSTKTIITSNEIENTQSLNLRDIFKNDPSIAIGGGSVMGQRIYVRGFETFMMRVTIDGAAQTGNAFHHQGNIMIDPSLLKQVIVSKGVSDASNGPGGLAGSIAFQTKDASDFLKKGEKFGAEIVGGFYTNFGYRTQASAYTMISNDIGVLVSVNHQNILNYKDAKNVYNNFLTTRNAVIGSNSLQNNILLKVSGQIDENKRFSIGYNVMNDFANRPFRADIGNPQGENFNSEIFKTHNQNQNFNASYEYKPIHGKTGIKTTVYNNIKNVNLTPLFEPSSNVTGNDEGSLGRAIIFNNYGGNVQFSNDFDDIHMLEYGLDFQGISVRDDNMQKSEQESINRGREETYIFGGFAQDSWQILPNLKWGFGSRADLYYYYDKNSQNHFTGGLSPSTAIYYKPYDGLDISIRYAFSTRGAMPGDATLIRNSDIVVNPNLKPEYSNHAEFTLDYDNDFMSARFSTYVGNILNFINSYSKGTINNQISQREGIRENLDFPIINYGFELGAQFYYDNFTLQLVVARNWLTAGGVGRGRLLADTYELGATWGYAFNVSIKYEIDKFDVSWFSRFVTGFKDGTQGFNIYQREFENIGKEGYTISDVHFNYYPMGKDKLILRFSILNIFNEFYVDPTSPLKVEADNLKNESINQIRAALYEPGIDYRIEVRYRF